MIYDSALNEVEYCLARSLVFQTGSLWFILCQSCFSDILVLFWGFTSEACAFHKNDRVR